MWAATHPEIGISNDRSAGNSRQRDNDSSQVADGARESGSHTTSGAAEASLPSFFISEFPPDVEEVAELAIIILRLNIDVVHALPLIGCLNLLAFVYIVG